jgi:tetratricopeptide (TPR) repeat protein
MIEKNQPVLAKQLAETALGLAATSDMALHQMGVAVSKLGSTDEAAGWYNKALGQTEDFTPAIQGLAQLALEDGESETAGSYFQRALDIDPSDTSALVGLSRVSKIKSEDSEIFHALEAILPSAAEMSVQRQVAYRFAMGDIYDGLKRYDEAFAQYAEAARLKRSTITYDAEGYDRKVDEIIATFTPDFIDRLRAHANPSLRPMFVLGMPRSGTTMTETILASHSTVSGAGELSELQLLFGMDTSGGFPASLTSMSPKDIANCLAAYLEKLATVDPSSARVTDKMPANFHMLGLIHALFPNAKVIHTRRDAMDVCLSCFTRHFDRSQLQSYDLIEQGRFYLGYKRLMQHWQSVLPKGAFLTIDYEDLVAEPEQNIRKMLAFCDLEWEEGCLNFHKTKRRVKTASITQVRQPIYRSSVEKWRRYESHLAPLAELLDVSG